MALPTWPTETTEATESLWSRMFRFLHRDGVHRNASSDFAIAGDGTGLRVKVSPGVCIIRGFTGELAAQTYVNLETADPSNPRVDRIVLRLDLGGDSASIDVLAITGTPAASNPVAPNLVNTETVVDIPLGRVSVAAGTPTITSGNVTDERTYSGPYNIGTGTVEGLDGIGRTGTSGIPADLKHTHPITQQFIKAIVPVGTVWPYEGTSDPGGLFSGIWLIANNRTLSRGNYTDYYALVGTRYGVGDGSTSFNMSGYQDQFLSGAGTIRGAVGTSSGDDLGLAIHTHDPVQPGDPYQMVISSGVAESHQIATSEAPGNTNVTFSAMGSAGTADPRLAIPKYTTVNYIVKVL